MDCAGEAALVAGFAAGFVAGLVVVAAAAARAFSRLVSGSTAFLVAGAAGLAEVAFLAAGFFGPGPPCSPGIIDSS